MPAVFKIEKTMVTLGEMVTSFVLGTPSYGT